jgi:hypothetical protein
VSKNTKKEEKKKSKKNKSPRLTLVSSIAAYLTTPDTSQIVPLQQSTKNWPGITGNRPDSFFKEEGLFYKDEQEAQTAG